MDDRRFDALARALAAPGSRRRALRLLAGGALGGLLGLRAEPASAAAPRLTAAPRVVTKTATGATVAWRTDVAADSLVRYGATHTYPKRAYDAVQIAVHRVALVGLTPNTLHHYQVRSGNAAGASAFSADAHVRTCPSARPAFCRRACAAPDDPRSTACCVDLVTDERHCGRCGGACSPGETCCGGGCVDAAVDPTHCGGCNRPCRNPYVCVERVCEGGTCRQMLRDEACPDGGFVCDAERGCVCPEGQPSCPGEVGGQECCPAGTTCVGTPSGPLCCASGKVCVEEQVLTCCPNATDVCTNYGGQCCAGQACGYDGCCAAGSGTTCSFGGQTGTEEEDGICCASGKSCGPPQRCCTSPNAICKLFSSDCCESGKICWSRTGDGGPCCPNATDVCVGWDGTQCCPPERACNNPDGTLVCCASACVDGLCAPT